MNAYDVVVVGGGSAGIGAAVSAARQGARTLLIERFGYGGGAGSASLVHTVCGLYHPDTTRPAEYLNHGVVREFADELQQRCGLDGPVRMGRVYVLPHHPSAFAATADSLFENERTLDVWFHCECGEIKAMADGWALTIHGRPAQHQITASALVDASGDATVAQRIAGEREIAPAHRLLRPGYIVALHGVDTEVLDDQGRIALAGLIGRAIRDGALPAVLAGTVFRRSPFSGEAFVTIDLEAGGEAWDPDSPSMLSEVEATGRKAACCLVKYLRENHAAFAKTGAPIFPARAGVRETWRWVGDANLEKADVLESRRHEDEVALGGWPIELRENARGPKLTYAKIRQPYGIPLGCLIPKNKARLFTAGRCLSASHEAMASLRVMGTALATGQAAGIAAALSASSDGRSPLACDVRERLVATY